MKTKEEIEQLAEEFTTRDHGHYHYRGKECFIKGYMDSYIQCQEDMADKKYTIKEVERYHNIRATQGIKNANNYINSLNKQD
jgi:hypothetical protein